RDRHGSGQGRLARGHRTRGLDLGCRSRARDELPPRLAAGRHDEPLLPRAAGGGARRRGEECRRPADRGRRGGAGGVSGAVGASRARGGGRGLRRARSRDPRGAAGDAAARLSGSGPLRSLRDHLPRKRGRTEVRLESSPAYGGGAERSEGGGGAGRGAISTLHWVVRRLRLSNTSGVSASEIVSVMSRRGSIAPSASASSAAWYSGTVKNALVTSRTS